MRHRLTGAVIIVGLAVLVISMLLKEPENYSSVTIQKAESDIKIFPQSAATTDGNLILTADKKSNANTTGLKTAQTTTASSLPPRDILENDISLSGSGWSVRVGTYSDTEHVDAVSALLINNGFRARHTQVPTTLGVATRIWLGPYTKKATAEKVSLRLKVINGEKGYVTRHPS